MKTRIPENSNSESHQNVRKFLFQLQYVVWKASVSLYVDGMFYQYCVSDIFRLLVFFQGYYEGVAGKMFPFIYVSYFIILHVACI
jgi:hypothetical protein